MEILKAIEILQEPGIPWGGEALKNHYVARQLAIEALNEKLQRDKEVSKWKFPKLLKS